MESTHRATLDLRAGHVRTLEIAQAGRKIQPLHTAPWVDDPAITGDATIPTDLRCLSGDFFCAPFAASDLEDAPPHGWPANSALNPMGEVEVRNVIGGVALPGGWSKVAVAIAGPSQVTLTDAGGARLSVPLDGAFIRTGR